jgi:hypothetical protein
MTVSPALLQASSLGAHRPQNESAMVACRTTWPKAACDASATMIPTMAAARIVASRDAKNPRNATDRIDVDQ